MPGLTASRTLPIYVTNFLLTVALGVIFVFVEDVQTRQSLSDGEIGLIVGAGFAFAVSLGEFGATSFIPRRAELLTAPVALFRLLGTPGDQLRGQAMALSVVIMVMVATAVLAIESSRSTNEGAL